MQDFIIRCQHFSVLTTLPIHELRTAGVWFGGMFHPEAYLTAMRQVVAQENGWPLENVKLRLIPLTNEEFAQKDPLLTEHKNAFLIHSLILEGAEWLNSQLIPSDAIRSYLDEVLFDWELVDMKRNDLLSVPIYLNEERSDLLYIVEMTALPTIPIEMWRQRAVSIIAWRQA